jgi:hypothetical protein
MAEVKVMRARADGSRAVKGECWVLTDESKQSGDTSLIVEDVHEVRCS